MTIQPQYKIVRQGEYHDEFVAHVNRLVSQGWQPVGPAQYSFWAGWSQTLLFIPPPPTPRAEKDEQ